MNYSRQFSIESESNRNIETRKPKRKPEKLKRTLEAAYAKALETAYAYGIYHQLLEEKNWLDYGDLLFRAVRLLSENDDVRQQQRNQYKHILVDEYQDVNVASRILLKLLAGDGSGLWVVGDARQAIYRFIGASPTNILLLTTEDFPDAQTIKLDTNYRSQRPVVKVFAACAKGMNANETEENWNIERKDEEAADVRFFVSSDEKTEAADLAEEIKRLAEAGVEYREQAVLCRYHEDLASLSAALEDAGVPVLYLGNFFERPEIRDLLQIIAMATEPDGRSLYRLANFKEYGFEREDIKLLTNYLLENQFRFPGGLKRISDVKALSPEGRNKLELLGEHFKGFHPKNSAWNVLSQYLFVKSDYLRHLASDDSVRGKQKRLAIYQLLLLAHQLRDEIAEQEGDAKRNFLNYIRHLRIVGEDKQLRQTPIWADDINAVRLLTIHAAKGLEWSAVHLPTLSDGKFPKGKAPEKLLLSKSKSSKENADWQAEEENCLFFVGLSRARDYLRLYRARQYEFKEKQSSRLLKLIQSELPSAICKPLERVPPPAREVKKSRIIKIKREYAERQLRVYHQCPLEYEYRYILGISSPRSETPIGKTHLCVYRVGDAIKNEQKAGRQVTWELAEQKLTEVWAESGPLTHPYEAEYRIEAKGMIQKIVERDPLSEVRIIQPDWKIELENGIVIVRPDFVDLIDDGSGKMKVVVETLNFGSSPEKAPQDDVYVLLDIAAEQTYPELNRQIRATYMTDNQAITLNINNNWRRIGVRNYEKAIDGILNEDFNPKVDKKHCPFCTYFMMCSSNDGNPIH